MEMKWFKKRSYRHFDRPVGNTFAKKVMNPAFVSKHSFSPLIHYVKKVKHYKYYKETKRRSLKTKKRHIKYASHRDSCILTYYASLLNERLNDHYEKAGISDNVIAYRGKQCRIDHGKLGRSDRGKSNYESAADALTFARENAPVVILAFDVTDFFGNLNHKLLKNRLKHILGVCRLEDHWFKVFRHVTKYYFVERADLEVHPKFGDRLNKKGRDPIATIGEIKEARIKFHKNQTPGKGIPQGTPISAIFSNLYMIDFDASVRLCCDEVGAFYRRYSDDILVICKPNDVQHITGKIEHFMAEENLELSPDKTERTLFGAREPHLIKTRSAQYLGFDLNENGATIRRSSLSRQWRKMRRAFKQTRRIAESKINAGKADKVWTKRLRRRFMPLRHQNFSSYGRRSMISFGSNQKIRRQLRRFERAVEHELQDLANIKPPRRSTQPPPPPTQSGP